MSSLEVGIGAMGGMKPMGQGLLPPWVTWLWLAALAAVLVLHCGHLVQVAGQHRWYHASHILMLVSMLYMYASMELGWKWFPSGWSVALFSVSTAAIAGWLALRMVRRRPFSALWILAVVMQAAMVYMWLPSWAPVLTWALVAYYGLETVAWLAGLLDDSRPAMAVGPLDSRSPVTDGEPVTGPAATTGGGLLVSSRPVMAARHRAGVAHVPLAQNTRSARIGMAVMAASMGYMFAAMQLMR